MTRTVARLVAAALVISGCTEDADLSMTRLGNVEPALDMGVGREAPGHRALRAGAIHAVQRDAGDSYDARSTNGVWWAPTAHFEVRYRDAGVALRRAAHGPDDGTISLRRVGCPSMPHPTETSEANAGANRVHYDHRAGPVSVSEWYLSGPLGLEQGFTIPTRPPCLEAEQELVLEMEVSDFDLTQSGEGDAITLTNRASGISYRYAELYAEDATGRELTSRLALVEGGVQIRLDASSAMFPVRIDPLLTLEQMKLTPNDGIGDGNFGIAVAMDEDTAAVGAHYSGGTISGNVYIFVRAGGSWSQQAKLSASDAFWGDGFGTAVALSGDTVIAGASNSGGSSIGAAYIFVRAGNAWTQQAKVVAFDQASADFFGSAVAVAGDTAVVGANGDDHAAGVDAGSAYVFTRSGTAWTLQTKLVATDAAPIEHFAHDVAISGDTVVIGAHNSLPTLLGGAYVFIRSSGVWTQQAKLIGSSVDGGDRYGDSVSVSGDTALVGSPNDDHGNQLGSGSAYAFTRSSGIWSEQARLTASDAAPGDQFGDDVALDADSALVLAPFDDNRTGGTYLFVRSGAAWSEEAKFVASDAVQGDCFSTCVVAVAGDTGLVGVFEDDHAAGSNAGSTYVIVIRKTNGETCDDAGECASGFCVDGVCCDDACGASDPADCHVCSIAAGGTTDGTCDLLPGTVLCDDGNACTVTDYSCQPSVCVGWDPVACFAMDGCHDAGVCDPATGVCSDPPAANGTACDDIDACTQVDECEDGTCAGESPVACLPLGSCHDAGSCDPTTGMCSNPTKVDGSRCPGGACVNGICLLDELGGGGGGGGGGETGGAMATGGGETGGAMATGGSPANGGSGGHGGELNGEGGEAPTTGMGGAAGADADSGDEGTGEGCNCLVAGRRSGSTVPWLAMSALGVAFGRRRRGVASEGRACR